jgi:sec-independent protein translocase protein TatB
VWYKLGTRAMFSLGFGEIVIIALILIVVVGPERLPSVMKNVGKTLRTVRQASRDLRETVGLDEMMREDVLRPMPPPRRPPPATVSRQPDPAPPAVAPAAEPAPPAAEPVPPPPSADAASAPGAAGQTPPAESRDVAADADERKA